MIIGWEDFPIGRTVTTPAVTVTESHVVQFAAITGDWYYLHMNEAASTQSVFGQRIVHGPLTFSLAVGLMYQAQVFGDSIIAWLGTDNLRALAPVFFGDTIHINATVSGSRATKEPGRGVVSIRYEAMKSNGESVMSFDSVLLMNSKYANKETS